MIRAALPLFMLVAALAGCASPLSAESAPIRQAQTEQEFAAAIAARWSIEVYSGGGIPGTAGADVIVPDYLSVLQAIVDECQLGASLLVHATEGVSLLSILNDDLSPDQVACIRGKQRVGLRLNAKGSVQ